MENEVLDLENDVKSADNKKADDKKSDASAGAPPPSDEGQARVRALEEALRISEESRKRLEELIPRQTKPEPQQLTREQLAELWQQDPLKAVEYMQDQRIRLLEENLHRRLEPLVQGTSVSVREAMKAKYPDEFALFGDDIEKVVSSVPDKSIFNNPSNWEDLISWVRGKPGNLEKLVDHWQRKQAEKAKAEQAAAAGAHAARSVRTPSPASEPELDPVEREIARTMFYGMREEDAYNEYKKWRGVS